MRHAIPSSGPERQDEPHGGRHGRPLLMAPFPCKGHTSANGVAAAIFSQVCAARSAPRRARRQSMRRSAADVGRTGLNRPRLSDRDCGPGVVAFGARLANLAPRDRIGDIRNQGRWRAGAVCGRRERVRRRQGPRRVPRTWSIEEVRRLPSPDRLSRLSPLTPAMIAQSTAPAAPISRLSIEGIVAESVDPSLRSGFVAPRPIG